LRLRQRAGRGGGGGEEDGTEALGFSPLSPVWPFGRFFLLAILRSLQRRETRCKAGGGEEGDERERHEIISGGSPVPLDEVQGTSGVSSPAFVSRAFPRLSYLRQADVKPRGPNG